MFRLPDNAAIIRYRDVLEKRRQRKGERRLLDMSVTQILAGYWMVCVSACRRCPVPHKGVRWRDMGRTWRV